MRKWLLIVLLALVGLVAAVTLVGMLMPRDHVASSSVIVGQPPDSIWPVVRSFDQLAAWWPDVRSVERGSGSEGREAYRLDMTSGQLPLVVRESSPPSRLVTEIDPTAGGPFGGTWTYVITPVDGGSRVTVTEDGWISNPIFRFVANVFLGMHANIDGYLRALGQRFGEELTPVHEQ